MSGEGGVECIDEAFNALTKEGEKRSGNGFAEWDGFEGMGNRARPDTQGSGEGEESEEFFAALEVSDVRFFPGEAIGFHGFKEAFDTPALAIGIAYIVGKTHGGCEQQEIIPLEAQRQDLHLNAAQFLLRPDMRFTNGKVESLSFERHGSSVGVGCQHVFSQTQAKGDFVLPQPVKPVSPVS